ncbi:MAG: bifunctional DNA primase/polymerase, partial [Burkholderiales bacterium]|nr:bifunctional DNA primase/polymerase [Anaerolineae bacterium]
MQKLKQKLTENGLFQAAKRYKNDGFSIIPVNAGSSHNVKSAATTWKPFQKRQPTLAEITHWFSESNPDIGIGIVCGRVSQLIVLDLDDDANATFRDFNHGMADLLQTYTVRTPGRKGLHIYWRVNFPVASKKVRGGDLQAEGKYVVAPPTIINGQPYQPINDLPIKTLQPQELRQILDFLSVLPQPDCSLPQPNNKTRSMTTNEQSLSDFYYHISHKAGRNNGLFAAARKARN